MSTTDDPYADIEAAARGLAQITTADILRAQQAAETACPPEPGIIPCPEFPTNSPPGRLGGIARYRCPLGCPWFHDEPTDPGPLGPLLLPAGFTPADVDAALTAQAAERGRAQHARVEAAITSHYTECHPEHA